MSIRRNRERMITSQDEEGSTGTSTPNGGDPREGKQSGEKGREYM